MHSPRAIPSVYKCVYIQCQCNMCLLYIDPTLLCYHYACIICLNLKLCVTFRNTARKSGEAGSFFVHLNLNLYHIVVRIFLFFNYFGF